MRGRWRAPEQAERHVPQVYRAHAPERGVAFNEILQAEREKAADDEVIDGIRRERDKMRQRNSRLCRKYGLKTRRQRRQG